MSTPLVVAIRRLQFLLTVFGEFWILIRRLRVETNFRCCIIDLDNPDLCRKLNPRTPCTGRSSFADSFFRSIAPARDILSDHAAEFHGRQPGQLDEIRFGASAGRGKASRIEPEPEFAGGCQVDRGMDPLSVSRSML